MARFLRPIINMGSLHRILSLTLFISLALIGCSGRETIKAGHSTGNPPYPQYAPGAPQPNPVAPIIGAEEEGEGVINEDILEGDDDADSEGPEIINPNEVNNSEEETVAEEGSDHDGAQPIGHLAAGSAAFNNSNFVNAAQQGGMAGFTMAVGGVAGAGAGGGAAGAGGGQGATDCSEPFLVGIEAIAMEEDRFFQYIVTPERGFSASGEAPLSVALFPTLNQVRIPREATRYQYHWLWNNSSWSRNRAPGFVINNPGTITLSLKVSDTLCPAEHSDTSVATLEVTPTQGGAAPPAPPPPATEPDEPPAEPPVSAVFVTSSPPSATVTPVVTEPETPRITDWQPFELGFAAHMTLAMSDRHAIMVKSFGSDLYYKLYDLIEKIPMTSQWVKLQKPGELRCETGSPYLEQPSVAISGRREKVMLAFMKTCDGKSNVLWEKMTLRYHEATSLYSLDEDDMGFMNQTGKKWAPVAMVNSADDFAVAWVRLRKTDLPDNPERPDSTIVSGPIDTKRILKKVYMKIFPVNGQDRDLIEVLPPTYPARINAPDYDEQTVTRVEDSILRGSSFGASFCFTFRRVYKDYYGQRTKSDTEEMICKTSDNAIILQRSTPLSTSPPALASLTHSSDHKLVTVDPDGTMDLSIKVWSENGSSQNFILQGEGGSSWSQIDHITALDRSGFQHIILNNIANTKTLVTRLPDGDSSYLDIVREISLTQNSSGSASSIRQSSNDVGQMMTIWRAPDFRFYGVLGTIDP